MEFEMFYVTYTYYGSYQKVRWFDDETSAKKFFYYISKQRGVTKTEYSARG